MIFKNDTEIFELIKTPKNKVNIDLARKRHSELNMHINGVDVKVQKIDGYEDDTQKKLRDKLTRSNKSLYARLLKPNDKVFSAKGGSRYYELSDRLRKDFTSATYKGYTIQRWVKQCINKFYVDPNGLFFVEVGKDGEPYPTYKSINSIRDYGFDGLICQYVIFEPKELPDGVKQYRVVDDRRDIIVQTKDGENFDILKDETYRNILGRVPAIRISQTPDDVYNIMASPVETTLETAEEYLQNNSTKSVYKYLHLYPIFWRYLEDCSYCQGTGEIEGKTCKYCNGSGLKKTKSVSEVIGLPQPKDAADPTIAPNVAGYVQPDLETLREMREEFKQLIKEMEFDLWGSNTREDSSNETATAAFLNVQPVYDKLNDSSLWAEYVDKSITDFIGEIKYRSAYKGSSISYGRRYILETPDVIFDKYVKYKAAGSPKTTLDYFLTQYYQSQFESDSTSMLMYIKLLKIEPFVHSTDVEIQGLNVNQIDYYKKIYFNEWVKTLKQENILVKDFTELDAELTVFAQTKVTAAVKLPSD